MNNTPQIKIIVNGAFGKMGNIATTALEQQADFSVVAKLGSQDNLAESIEKHQPDIVIDLTNPEFVYQNSLCIIKANCRPIIGTSGLKANEIANLQEICAAQSLGGIIAPNFSIGVLLMIRYAADAAKYFSWAEVIEAHHHQKVDSPSSTSLRTAEVIADNLKSHSELVKQKQTIPGARGATHHQIPIHSIRMPGVVARQQVIFGDNGETLTIQHDSINRECFMPGIILACHKVLNLNTLIYGLENLL